MPKLQTFTAQPQGVTLPESGRDAVYVAGRGLAKTVSGAADFLAKRAEEDEVSDVQTRMAQARSAWTIQLKERSDAAVPGDHGFSFKFAEDVSADLDKIGENVQTRAGKQAFAQLSNALLTDMNERASIQQATLSGVKAKQNELTKLERSGNTLLNDPTQFDRVLDQTLTALGANTQLPGAVRSEMKRTAQEELARYAVQGVIRNVDPALAKEQLNAGQWDKYLKPEHKAMLLAQAEQGISAQRTEAERQKKLAKEVQEAERETTRNGFMEKFVSGKLSTRDVLDSNLESFGNGSKKSFLDMLDERNRTPKILPNTAVVQQLFNRIHLPEGDPKKIVNDADLLDFFGKGLDEHWLTTLRNEVQNENTQQGKEESLMKDQLLRTARSALTDTDELLRISDPYGDQQYLSWLSQFLSTFKAGRAAGKSAVDMLTPGSKDYLGASINSFYVPPTERMRRAAEMLRGYEPPENAGRPAMPTDPKYDYRWNEEQKTWQRKLK